MNKPVVEVCPACEKGTVGTDRSCTHCRVVVPRGAAAPSHVAGKRRYGRGPDHDKTSAMCDMIRYKEDHR